MSNSQLSKGFKNIKYSLIAQTLILVVGILKTFGIAAILTTESFAYWQMYVFYIGYVGFFYLGYNDGILLKYGSLDYEQLPFKRIRSSIRYYITMLLVFSCIVFIAAWNISDTQKAFVMSIVAISIVMYGLYGVFIYIFLITNQIKKHSFFTAVDSVSSFIGLVFMFLLKRSDFYFLIIFVFLSKLISVVVMAIMCRKLWLGSSAPAREGLGEFVDNIKAGIFLMLAQVMSMLVTGLGRIFIEYGSNLNEYAYYAFGITVMGMVMVGVTAVATVMYPTLGRVEKDVLPQFFQKMYQYFTHFTVFSLLLYFPAYLLVGIFFQKYTPMLSYFVFFFAMMTWQAKVNITTSTYFRVLRMERKMMKINILSVLFFCFSYFLLRLTIGHLFSGQVTIVAISTFLSMVFLEILAEQTLRKALGLRFDRQLAKDIVINLIFLVAAFIPNKYWGFAVYGVFVLIYSYLQRNELRTVMGWVIRSLKAHKVKVK